MVYKISLKETLKSADWVLWIALTPDWKMSTMQWASRWDCSCKSKASSRTLGTNGNCDRDLKFDNVLGFRSGFLIAGSTVACLKNTEEETAVYNLLDSLMRDLPEPLWRSKVDLHQQKWGILQTSGNTWNRIDSLMRSQETGSSFLPHALTPSSTSDAI